MKETNMKIIAIVILSVLLSISVIINLITIFLFTVRLAPYEKEKEIADYYYKNRLELNKLINTCNETGICYVGLHEDNDTYGVKCYKVDRYYIYSMHELDDENKKYVSDMMKKLNQHNLSNIYINSNGGRMLFVFSYGMFGINSVGLLYEATGKYYKEIKEGSYYEDVWGIDDNWYIVK